MRLDSAATPDEPELSEWLASHCGGQSTQAHPWRMDLMPSERRNPMLSGRMVEQYPHLDVLVDDALSLQIPEVEQCFGREPLEDSPSAASHQADAASSDAEAAYKTWLQEALRGDVRPFDHSTESRLVAVQGQAEAFCSKDAAADAVALTPFQVLQRSFGSALGSQLDEHLYRHLHEALGKTIRLFKLRVPAERAGTLNDVEMKQSFKMHVVGIQESEEPDITWQFRSDVEVDEGSFLWVGLERESFERVQKYLGSTSTADLHSSIQVAGLPVFRCMVLPEWRGKSLLSLNLKHEYGMVVVAIEQSGKELCFPQPQVVVLGNTRLLFVLTSVQRFRKQPNVWNANISGLVTATAVSRKWRHGSTSMLSARSGGSASSGRTARSAEESCQPSLDADGPPPAASRSRSASRAASSEAEGTPRELGVDWRHEGSEQATGAEENEPYTWSDMAPPRISVFSSDSEVPQISVSDQEVPQIAETGCDS